MPTHSIYALCEPDGVTVRYVGRTRNSSGERYTQHMDKARLILRRGYGKAPDVYRWIVGLLRQDKTPIVTTIATCDASIVAQVESEWIVAMKRSGYDLLNIAPLSRSVTARCPSCDAPLLSAKEGSA